MKETLIAEDLLKEELDELLMNEIPEHSYIPTRISNLQDALIEISNFKKIINNHIKIIENFEKLAVVKDDIIQINEQYISNLESRNLELIKISQDTIKKFKQDTSVKSLIFALFFKIFNKKG